MKATSKLHLGAGTKILSGYINHDLVPLTGIDLVHDLESYPWPLEDNSIDEIIAENILEHIDNIVRFMEEIHRITRMGAIIKIDVPYWNSWEAITDPTHKSIFNEYTFDFFDPNKDRCKNRPYYTKARFNILRSGFVICAVPSLTLKVNFKGRNRSVLGFVFPWKPLIIYNKIIKWPFSVLASYLNNIIIGINFELEKK